MPVALYTGLPGAGKTASLVKRIVDLQEKEPGRPVFYMGINGLKPGFATELTIDQLENWWTELPPGSIIALDECQEDHLMPKDRGNPSAWVQKITKVRHFGMDFLLTTQHPANMSAYVRRLVDLHVHSVMRSKGVRQTFTWMRCIDDPDSRKEKKFADMSFSPLPKEVFELYKSSSLHTMKVRTPRKVYMLAALVLCGLVAIGGVVYRLHGQVHQAKVQQAAAQPLSQPSKADMLRQADFLKWMKPRIDGIPWSSPMFDKLDVKAQPRLFCVAVDDGRCTCNTEQGTRYEVPVKMCRQIVENGLYNPFLAPTDPTVSTSSSGSDSQQPDRQEAALRPVGRAAADVDGSPVASAGGWQSSPMQSDYVPPQLMKPMEPIPHTF